MKVGLFLKQPFRTPTSEGSRQGTMQLETGEVLMCDAIADSCVTSRETHFWTLPAEFDVCPRHLTKRTEGIDLSK